MHFSKTSGYAIHALVNIGNAVGQTCFVRDIARDTGLKKPYLAKIINQLVHRGFLLAKRGYRGGVTLAKPAEQISLLQVVQAMEGESWRHDCIFGLDMCPGFNSCPAHAAWKEMQDRIEGLLALSTLAELMKTTRRMGHSGRAARKASDEVLEWAHSLSSGLRRMHAGAARRPGTLSAIPHIVPTHAG